MRKTFRVLIMVSGGILGGYYGYWIGHLAGWSRNADWPFKIGGGDGAILMSMGMAVVGVLVAGLWLGLPPYLNARRLGQTGLPSTATILKVHDLGFRAGGLTRTRRQLEFVVELASASGATRQSRVVQWMSEHDVATLQPGREVTVRYDPARPDRVVIEGAERLPIG